MNNEKRNLKVLEELALAYERQGSKLHPILLRVTSHLRRVDCIYKDTSCKYYKDKKCKLTSYNKYLCPYRTSASSGDKASKRSSSTPISTGLRGDGVFHYQTGRGFYCTTCKSWLKCLPSNNIALQEHINSKKHRCNLE